VTGELVTTFPRRLHFNLDGSEFDNFGAMDNFMINSVGVFSEKPGWVLMDGQIQEILVQ
jgi:hypothetical protein